MPRTSPLIGLLAAAAAAAIVASAASGAAARGPVLVTAARTFVPNDPLWPREWAAKTVGAPRAWTTTRGRADVVIATVDSGVEATHPDLRGGLVAGFDLAKGADDPADDNGHGTAVAGVIGARADNRVGISGICPRCTLMAVKVTRGGSAPDSTVAAGMRWAVDRGARVLNVSLGAGSSSQTIDAAVRYAQSKGAVVVAAAGNGGSSEPFYPAASDGVVAVASTDRADRLYRWSNRGSWVDVAAPGCAYTTARGGRYAEFCGTSASAPIVAGLVGLVIAAAPTATPADVVRAVTATAHPVPGVAAGRVDAAAAIQSLKRRVRGAGLLRRAALERVHLEPRRGAR